MSDGLAYNARDSVPCPHCGAPIRHAINNVARPPGAYICKCGGRFTYHDDGTVTTDG